jgi:hypothetical protein
LKDGRKHILPDGHTRTPLIALPADETAKYWVGQQPGYIDRDAYLKEVEAAFGTWAKVSPLSFEQVADAQDADITITFMGDEEGSSSPIYIFS